MPYRRDVEARRLRCAILESELAELRVRVGALAVAQTELLAKERELLGLRRSVATSDGAGEARVKRAKKVVLATVVLGGALLSAGLLLTVPCMCRSESIKTTQTSAWELRRAASVWRAERYPNDPCPTTEQLRADRAIDAASKLTDSWGHPFKIVCDRAETYVGSTGADAKEGTYDDLWTPWPPNWPSACRRKAWGEECDEASRSAAQRTAWSR
jgi:hypothetical protein